MLCHFPLFCLERKHGVDFFYEYILDIYLILSVCLSVCLSICLSLYLFVCMQVLLSYLYVHFSMCKRVCLSAWLPVSLPIYLVHSSAIIAFYPVQPYTDFLMKTFLPIRADNFSLISLLFLNITVSEHNGFLFFLVKSISYYTVFDFHYLVKRCSVELHFTVTFLSITIFKVTVFNVIFFCSEYRE